MPVLVPSLVLSIFANYVTGAKVVILTWRHWHKQILTWQYWHKQILAWRYWHKQVSEIDIALTVILLVINILLLVFSIQQEKEIARQILLSLTNGGLILYQVRYPVLLRSCADRRVKFSVDVCVDISSWREVLRQALGPSNNPHSRCCHGVCTLPSATLCAEGSQQGTSSRRSYILRGGVLYTIWFLSVWLSQLV